MSTETAPSISLPGPLKINANVTNCCSITQAHPPPTIHSKNNASHFISAHRRLAVSLPAREEHHTAHPTPAPLEHCVTTGSTIDCLDQNLEGNLNMLTKTCALQGTQEQITWDMTKTLHVRPSTKSIYLVAILRHLPGCFLGFLPTTNCRHLRGSQFCGLVISVTTLSIMSWLGCLRMIESFRALQ